ncbi:hypothetical protein ABZ252_16235 [Streptomyces sp. NPDC006175]
MDSPTGAVFIGSPTRPANFRTKLHLVEKVALAPSQSSGFIHSVAKEL